MATNPPSAGHAGKHRTRRWPKILRRIGFAALALVVVAGVGMVTAEHYMAKPAFCGSCHIMESYYKSWSRDVHGWKLGARCVDCHYAPGERFTFKAKFKGLSQVTSYFSGRAGRARPRAHVSDASCLTAACHGDRAFVPKTLLIGQPRVEKRIVGAQTIEVQRAPTVSFVHSKHLSISEKLADTGRRLEGIKTQLKAAVAKDVYGRLCRVAVSVESASEREQALRGILRGTVSANAQADALEMAQLEHLKTRQEQLAGLTCAACHFYDPSGNNHLTVDRQTCFTCHFTNQAFNRDTGACLLCHAPPTRMIQVHEPSATRPAGTTLMDHQEVVRRKIDCASCHLDVVRSEGQVAVRECVHCHDQQSYLAAFATRTTFEVEQYHRAHAAAQRARCPDCHLPVRHGMVEPTYVATRSGFIQTVLDNCQHCHPNHHYEQVDLLMGVGGEGVGEPMPNAMFGSRINCQACHTLSGSDFKGDLLIKATAATCVACHGEEYRSLLDQWIHEVDTHLKEADDAVDRLAKRIERLRSEGRTIPERVQTLLDEASHNIHLVKAGNGIHNKNYAFNLLDASRAFVQQAEALLPARQPASSSGSP